MLGNTFEIEFKHNKHIIIDFHFMGTALNSCKNLRLGFTVSRVHLKITNRVLV